jgi:polyisoprenoid-binding protein YceI
MIRKTLAPAWLIPLIFLLFCLSSFPALAQTQQLLLQFTSGDCKIGFTLGDILHTVHGSFKLKRGEVGYDLATKSASGALVIDATSGQSNNRVRDRKMHREILESERYPEIIFRPDRVDGTVAPTGTSTLQVHGIFSLHGAEHEFTMPVRLQVFPDHWTAESSFVIPYVKWGIKNPSTFFLRVSSEVEIEVHATGINPFVGGAAH